MSRRALVSLAAVAVVAGAAGCGAPDELDSDDDRALASAREELDDALDTEETVRTAPELGRRLARGVERAGDNPRALERLVPSLVNADGEVDSEAVDDFVRHAGSDAQQALLVPARDSVDQIVEVIDDSGADGDTTVPHDRDRPMGRYVDQIERDIRDVWPQLSQELEEAL
jgi:hypothetical protein